MRAIDGRVEDPEAARARREDRLEADRPLRVAELGGCRRDLARAVRRGGSPAPGGRAASGARRSRPCRSSGGSSPATTRSRAPPRRRTGRDARRAPRGRTTTAGSTTSTRSRRQTSSTRVGEPGIRAGRHEVEGVAEVAPDRPLGHVRSDQPQLALAVLAQRAEQRRRPGRAGGRHEHGDRLHDRSIRSSAIWTRAGARARRRATRASTRASSRPRRPRSRGGQELEPLERRPRAAPRAGSRSASAGSSRSGSASGSKPALAHHVARRRRAARA